MEQYGYADEDAVVYRLAFADSEKTVSTDCKKYMEDNDFIKDRKNKDDKKNCKRNNR